MSVKPAFSFKLDHKVLPRLVVLGKFDGCKNSLALATVGGKVFVHTPGGSSSSSSANALTLKDSIKCLSAGTIDPSGGSRDLLFIGTQSHLQIYDIHDNADVFFQQVTEGVDVVRVGKLGRVPEPLAVCGGQCTLQGFNKTGDELYWTITGDTISSMILCPILQNGRNQLIVGSEDFDIRIFEDDEIVMEMKETAVVSGLVHLSGTRFGYSLENGTVGVYDKNNRLWRIKSKNQPLALAAYDLNGDGEVELIAGWSSGKVDARDPTTGEVLFKHTMGSAVAGIVVGDYTGSGKDELICCTVEGEINVFHQSEAGSKSLLDTNSGQDTVRNLQQKKNNLEMERNNYQLNAQMSAKIKSGVISPGEVSVIPADTEVLAELTPVLPQNPEIAPYIQLSMEPNNDVVIKAVVVFAEGIFPGESHVCHPTAANSRGALIPLRPPSNTVVDLHMKVFVGQNRSSSQLHVFELSRQLPKFSMFLYHPEVPSDIELPKCYVSFVINERINRIYMWFNNNFLLGEPVNDEPEMNAHFTYLRTGGLLVIKCKPERMTSKLTFMTDDIELAGDLVQSLFEFIALSEAECEAHFPHVLHNLKHLLDQVDNLYEARNRLTSEVADNSNIIKSLIIKAEDSRLLGDWKNMKSSYSELYTVNQGLVNSYKVRCDNQNELLATLKLVNQIIQRTANLRIGQQRSRVIEFGRAAVKESRVNQFEQFLVAK